MKADKKFEIILAKNRLARTVKRLLKGEPPSGFILQDFEDIELRTGTGNQPTAKEILLSDMDI
jgi:hypothetical protein